MTHSILPSQMIAFPGRVHQIAALQNQVTILADCQGNINHTVLHEDAGPQVYVLADTAAQDLEV